ncbi:DUF1329 domain-containing protein [Pseudomonas sp. NFXW11]|uniref:DUF1329 domain-containing protein n=1 Tax=Pseudomonas sp. NFXW11 TaxID=2819531 RepID=UPI003CE9B726
MHRLNSLVAGLGLAALCTLCLAAEPASPLKNADGQRLTPIGAQQAGNAAGSIGPWDGGLTQGPVGYKEGAPYLDPFAADRPLFTIDSKNLEQYREHLSQGQLALFKAYPETFRMPVYPTRRSAAAPQWVYDNIRHNAFNAKLGEGGAMVHGAYGGVPFPMPQSGLEALWNHILKFNGTYLERSSADIAVQRDGSFVPSLLDVRYYSLYNIPGKDAASLGDTLYYYLGIAKAPARLAGEAVLIHEPLNQLDNPRQAWGYNPGQRRVRRAPTVAYDSPIGSADGLRTADDTDMFNGSPDRYDWKLLGKQELYIPYNNYRLLDKGLKYSELLRPGHLNPEHARYELHRVWVVEGSLRPDARHLYGKRRFYLDEDSWSIAVADQFDSRGELWRVSMAYLVNYYNLPAVMSAVDVFHDLQSRRYQAQGLSNEQPEVIRFLPAPGDAGMFKPNDLPRLSGR